MSKVEYDQELLDRLDPDRDYGKRTYEQLKLGVISGAFTLSEGYEGKPRILNAQTRRYEMGSAPPPKSEGESDRSWFQRRFNERFAEDFDKIYEAQLANATGKKKDSRDIENMMSRGGGRPSQQTSAGADDVIDFFRLLAQATTSNELTVVDVESKEIETPDAS